MRLFLSFCLLLAAAPFANAASPIKLKLGSESSELRLLTESKSVALEVLTNGKTRQTFEKLGEEFEKITFNGKQVSMLALDFDRDGFEEFIVRTTQPPLIGALWVFRWDKEKKAYAHVKSAHGDHFIHVPLSAPVSIAGNGNVSFALPGSNDKVEYRWNGKLYEQK